MDLAGVAPVAPTKRDVRVSRPEPIVRERLNGLLDEAVERPLTMVCAPAGYGKTTAVATWLDTQDGRPAWVSLDPMHNDPRRFCGRLLAALDGALPGAGAGARQALRGGSDLQETVLPFAVNALADRVQERLVVVLDDYHLIEHEGCHALLVELIDTLPVTVRIIVCTRTSPPFRLARRRALGSLAELGSRELCFQDGESEQLLNESLELGLAPGVVDTIESRSEGWAAGLALLASSPAQWEQPVGAPATRYQHVTGSRVAAYLTEEVLDRTEPRVREFLIRTSVLGRLSGSLCEAVLDDPSAHELLAEVRRSNLFVTTLDDDGEGEWLRYHHLFGQLLKRELNTRSSQLVPLLHRRASAWFAANGLPEEAIRHAAAARDGKLAAALLHDSWRDLLRERRCATVRRMIAQLPSDRGELAGFCEALDTLCMAHIGADLRLVAQRLDALEPLRESPGVAPMIDQLRVSPYYGDIRRAVKDGWAAWERHPSMRPALAGQLGAVLWFDGDHVGVRDLLEPRIGMIEDAMSRSWGLAALALTAADEGDAELAERYAREAVEVGEGHGQAGALGCHLAYVALSEALRLRGALDEAGEHLARAAASTSKLPGSVFYGFTQVFEAQLSLTRNERARAGLQAAAARAILDRYPDVGTLADRLARVEAGVRPRGGDDLRGSEPTAAELRVLALLPRELTMEQIAGELYLSIHTVNSHRRRLYRRLGATSREHAISAARDRGLL
jgi:LuxR family transcriptional regulator, maltose regulon positive regulatory protein